MWLPISTSTRVGRPLWKPLTGIVLPKTSLPSVKDPSTAPCRTCFCAGVADAVFSTLDGLADAGLVVAAAAGVAVGAAAGVAVGAAGAAVPVAAGDAGAASAGASGSICTISALNSADENILLSEGSDFDFAILCICILFLWWHPAAGDGGTFEDFVWIDCSSRPPHAWCGQL